MHTIIIKLIMYIMHIIIIIMHPIVKLIIIMHIIKLTTEYMHMTCAHKTTYIIHIEIILTKISNTFITADISIRLWWGK